LTKTRQDIKDGAMDNIKQTEQELRKLRERFLEDPIIEEHYKRLLSIYQHFIPIGINDNGFIYDTKTNHILEETKKSLNDYIKVTYKG